MKEKILYLVILILLPLTIISLTKTNEETKEKELPTQDFFVILTLNNEDITLSMEDYLIGVVASEMPADFSFEALKAQAIASRTIALYTLQSKDKLTTSLQNYLTKEEMKVKWQEAYEFYYEKIKKCVNDTQNLVMMYDNKLIKSYFYSTSNGYTATSLSVFNESLPYLSTISPSTEENASKTTTKTISKSKFCTLLNINCSSISISNITYDDSNRVKTISINNKTYTGISLRKLLNLRSTDFTIDINDEVTITTKGYGHGVGMSQYGAENLAKNGKTYQEILEYYYQGIEIKEFMYKN